MKLILESTSTTATVDGVPARVWEGRSESGVAVIAWITRVAVQRDQDCSEFERELQEHRPPSAEAMSFPLRMVL